MRFFNLMRMLSFGLVFIIGTSVFSFGSVQGGDHDFLAKMRNLSEARGDVWKAYKNYLLIGMNNFYKDPKTNLQKAIENYERRVQESESYLKERGFSQALGLVEKANDVWKPLKSLLLSKPHQKDVPSIDKKAKQTTVFLSKALKAMGKEGKSPTWKYLEQAQKVQNMAQRMATLYLAHAWGALGNERYKKQMGVVMRNYNKAISLIEKSSFITPKLKNLLKKMKEDYQYFIITFRHNTKYFIPSLIYQKSSNMDQKMGKATTLIMGALQS